MEDEAAFLEARLRVGDLSSEGLELAALCGHRAARAACAPAEDVSQLGFAEWAARFDRYPLGRDRLLTECARAVLPVWERSRSELSPRTAIARLDDWLDCPECLLAVEEAAIEAEELYGVNPYEVRVERQPALERLGILNDYVVAGNYPPLESFGDTDSLPMLAVGLIALTARTVVLSGEENSFLSLDPYKRGHQMAELVFRVWPRTRLPLRETVQERLIAWALS